jgi:hypothetical protein
MIDAPPGPSVTLLGLSRWSGGPGARAHVGVLRRRAPTRASGRYDAASQEMLQLLQKFMECQGDNSKAFWKVGRVLRGTQRC